MLATNPSARVIDTQLEYVVVSEGPYRFTTVCASLDANTRSTNSRFNGSPARFTVLTDEGKPLVAITVASAEGTVFTSAVPSSDDPADTRSFTNRTVAPTLN